MQLSESSTETTKGPNPIFEAVHHVNSDIQEIRRWPRGWRPYTALFAGFCGMASCWGPIMSFGPYFKFYDEHLLRSFGASKIGWIGSMQYFLVLFLSFIVGRLVDAKLHRWIAAAGGLLIILGSVCLSFTSGQGGENEGNYGLIFLTQGVTSGLGMACYFVLSSQLAVQWFPNHKYLAVGITSTGAPAGGLAFPPLIEILITRYGFPMAVRLQTASLAALSLVVLALAHPMPDARNRPLKKMWRMNEWIDTRAFKNRPFVLFSLAVSFVFFGYSPLLFHVTEWAEREVLGVLWFLSIMNGCSIVGRISGAAAASTSKRWLNPMLIHSTGSIVAAILICSFWPKADEKADALALCVVFGTLSGVMMGLPASCIASIIPAEYEDSLGVWTGMMWSCCSLLALAGPPVAGKLRNRFGIMVVGYWAGANLLMAGVLSGAALLANDPSLLVKLKVSSAGVQDEGAPRIGREKSTSTASRQRSETARIEI